MPKAINDFLSCYRAEFQSYFPEALSLLYSNLHEELRPAKVHLKNAAKYNVPGGKNIRALLCISAFDAFSNHNYARITKRHVNLIGWSIELMQAGFLIHDDLIDNSPLRRGKESWSSLQKRLGNNLISINDGLHMYISVQQLLLAILDTPDLQSVCFKLLKLFGECAHFTCLGQTLDILGNCKYGSRQAKEASIGQIMNCFDFLTLERFAAIAKWKTSYYSFVLPVTAGMLLAGVNSVVALENAKIILLRIGQYYQAQDDYLDVFGDKNQTGKTGTDIPEGKCSWPVAAAKEKASQSQLAILRANYGIDDPSCIVAVHRVFDELHVPELYATFEQTISAEIYCLIDEFCTPDFTPDVDSTKLPKDFFINILHFLSGRYH